MPNFKKAFSLTEIMVMLMIMAVIIVVAIKGNHVLSPKFRTLYYYTFINVRKFAGEVIADSPNKILSADDTQFCTSMIKNLNTVGGYESCSGFYDGTKGSPFGTMTAANLNNPSFSLSNGQRFYVSTRVNESPIGYRIISVDLNGKGKPNTFNQDVVPFVMFDTGEVIPTGTPATDTSYLTVNVMSFNVNTGNSTENFILSSSGKKFLNYNQGFCLAGYPTAYANYCSSYLVDPACAPGNPTTFCRMNLMKPLIRVKM